MKAILINSRERKVEEITINDWRDIAPAIGGECRLFTTGGYLANGDVSYVDDEGLVNGTEDFFFLPSLYPYPIAGSAVILGDDDEGGSVDCKSTVEDFAKVKFYNRGEVSRLTRQGAFD